VAEAKGGASGARRRLGRRHLARRRFNAGGGGGGAVEVWVWSLLEDLSPVVVGAGNGGSTMRGDAAWRGVGTLVTGGWRAVLEG
jgi:hypothetical protein